jgi:hypothetical protein
VVLKPGLYGMLISYIQVNPGIVDDKQMHLRPSSFDTQADAPAQHRQHGPIEGVRGLGLHAKPLDAAIRQVFALYCTGRTVGSNAIKNDEKVPYLSAVSLALLLVCRYVTKRIDQRRGSRSITEATG